MNRLNFEERFYSDEIKNSIKGFIKPDIIKILSKKEKNPDGTYKNVKSILSGMEYRPDIVAAYYYGDPSASWIIDFANNFTNGIKDYYPGRSIIIPDLDEIIGKLSGYVES